MPERPFRDPDLTILSAIVGCHNRRFAAAMHSKCAAAEKVRLLGGGSRGRGLRVVDDLAELAEAGLCLSGGRAMMACGEIGTRGCYFPPLPRFLFSTSPSSAVPRRQGDEGFDTG